MKRFLKAFLIVFCLTINTKLVSADSAVTGIKIIEYVASDNWEENVTYDLKEVTNITLKVGYSKQLDVLLNQNTNSVAENITWKSEDSTIASIDSSGVVVGRKIGTTVITATSSNGKSATCTVNVIVPPGVFKDGWHIVPDSSNTTYPSSASESVRFAYYKNGKEIKRIREFYYVHRGWSNWTYDDVTKFTKYNYDEAICSAPASEPKVSFNHGSINKEVDLTYIAPENSLAAFKLAKAHGYYGVETDIYFTKDHVPVLSHNADFGIIAQTDDMARNPDMSQITESTAIRNLTYQQLQNNYIFPFGRYGCCGGYFFTTNVINEDFRNNRITKFEELLAWVKSVNETEQVGMTIAIELKDENSTRAELKSLVDMVKQYNLNGVVRWTSFHIRLLEIINELTEGEVLALMLHDTGGISYNKAVKNTSRYMNSGRNVIVRGGAKTGHAEYPNLPKFVCLTKYRNHDDTDEYHYHLYKTENHYLWEYKEDEKTKITTIPQAEIKNFLGTIKLPLTESTYVYYNYDGDGDITCESSNPNLVTCNLDKENSRVKLTALDQTSVPSEKVTISLLGSQGIQFSAAAAKSLTVTLKERPPVLPTEISIPSTLNIEKGTKATISATILPSNATNKTVTWTSSDTSVATISSTGVISAIKGGKATITARTSNNLTASCEVTVIVPDTSIALSGLMSSIKIGESFMIIPTIYPTDATDKEVTWTSSNPSVATVSVTGKVKGISAGEATIIATTAYGNRAITTVTVMPPTILVESVTIDSGGSTVMNIGDTKQLYATIFPSNATNRTVTWTSSNPSVATISSTGNLTALKEGKTTITVTASNNKTASVEYTIVKPLVAVTNVEVTRTSDSIEIGKTIKFTAIVSPSDASNKEVTWTSSNTSVASVDSTGLVTGISAGSATITATSSNGIKGSATINVTNPPIEFREFALNKSNIQLDVGQSETINVVVYPNDNNKAVTWVSSNSSIARVNSNGTITGVAAGEAIITATASDGQKANVNVKVVKPVIEVTNVVINTPSTTSIKIGQSLTLNATIYPSNADDLRVSWTSSNTSVATVDVNGKVLGIGKGTTTITATSINGKKSSINIEVIEPIIEVDSITLSQLNPTINIGDTYSLTATIYPSNATDKTITWASNNSLIASVDQMGVITGVSNGSTTITATTNNGKQASVLVTVVAPVIEVTNITLNKTSTNINVGNSETLSATITPSDATNKTVTWTSSNSSVASVDSAGKVTALSKGTTVITATSNNGKKATCTVNVIVPVIEVDSISLNKTTLALNVGSSETLLATITPNNATNKEVIWTSSNSSVASVDANGKVTALNGGTTVITATSSNGKKATCTVNVIVPIIEVSGISLNKTSTTINVDATEMLIATITPNNATNKTVTWTSSDESIATVNEIGVVSALSKGSAVITATSSNGKKATCTVNAVIPEIEVTSVSLNKTSIDLNIGGTEILIATVNPSNATNKTIIWSSSNEAVATINSSGKITAVAEGTTIITALSSSGEKATCAVNVTIPSIEVTSVSLNKNSTSLVVGGVETLLATITPNNATNKTVTWTSSNPSIATVSSNGKVTAINVGTTVITAESNNGKKATCEVNVAASQVEVNSISLNKTSLTINAGTSETLVASILPNNATNQEITWTSSNSSVASVDANGKVTGIQSGNAVITAESNNGKKATCEINVVVPQVEVNSISLNKTSLTINAGTSETLVASILPSNATNKTVTWTSSNSSVASVDANGKVTGIQSGSAIITATSNNGKKATCTVNVVVPQVEVDSISLNKTSLTINVGTSETLVASILPSNATNKSVTWTSSNESVASVDANGKVTGIKSGTATITVESNNGKTSMCIVNVVVPQVEVDSISLNKTSLTINVGNSETLFASILPNNATNKSVTWTSSNSSVASVDANGKVTALSKGTATITAKSSNGKSATCTVSVISPTINVNSISLNRVHTTLNVGNSETLVATVLPSDATNKTITWLSSNSSVASVDSTGKVTALSKGTAIITAKSSNGKSATCEVEVVLPTIEVENIDIDKKTITINIGKKEVLTAIIAPNNATNKSVTWTSSNESVATVNNGTITGVNEGQTTITVETNNGKSATCEVTVLKATEEVKDIVLNKTSATINVGESERISIVAYPTSTLDKSVTWTSSDEAIATVNNGTITGVNEGQTTITVRTTDGKSANVDVTIVKPELIVELEDTTVEYTGKAPVVNATIIAKDNKEYSGEIIYDYYKTDNCSGEVMNDVPIDVNIYSVQARIDNAKYNVTNSKCATLTITKATSKINPSKTKVKATKKEIKLDFDYVGDGEITCTSNNADIKCEVDLTNKELNITTTDLSTGDLVLKIDSGKNYNSTEIKINVKNKTLLGVSILMMIYIVGSLVLIFGGVLIFRKINFKKEHSY